ncbi:hypothetical protein VNI00_004400 [Paramarasmius palmivorus]|uniref:Uncharacterized protein n=1 Tax=Paramarasmius palmivorus TaxID=297713 RepID=A0AAW0DP74_9AGAR
MANLYPPMRAQGRNGRSAFDTFNDSLDETIIMGELKACTEEFLLNHSPWLKGLDQPGVVKASLYLFDEYVDNIVAYLVSEISDWAEHTFNVYNDTCGVFPSKIDVFCAAAMSYCAENSIDFVGERPSHPLLIKFLALPSSKD